MGKISSVFFCLAGGIIANIPVHAIDEIEIEGKKRLSRETIREMIHENRRNSKEIRERLLENRERRKDDIRGERNDLRAKCREFVLDLDPDLSREEKKAAIREYIEEHKESCRELHDLSKELAEEVDPSRWSTGSLGSASIREFIRVGRGSSRKLTAEQRAEIQAAKEAKRQALIELRENRSETGHRRDEEP